MGDGDGKPGQAPLKQRRGQILEMLRQVEFVHVSELSDRFGVSEVTVRSDLDELESRGLLRRIRGGAIPRAIGGPERPFEESQVSHVEEKVAMGRAAAAMIRPGDTVVLDVGTTTTAVADALARRGDLEGVTVFTSSLTIALALEPAHPRLTVVVTGGTLRPLQHSLVDPLGGTILDNIHATWVFLGCNGVDPEAGVTNHNLPEAAIKQRMLAAASQRVAVADGSKVGAVSLYQLCSTRDLDLLLTGPSAPTPVLDALREQGLEVRVEPVTDSGEDVT